MGNKRVFTKFVKGKTSFISRGFAEIKITSRGEGEDPSQTSEILEIPIKSIGITELKEELKKKAPIPPSKLIQVDEKRNAALIKQFGVREGDIVKVYDVTDEDYLKEFAKYNDDFHWRIAISALDTVWEDETGKEITDFETKKEILINSGLTGIHLDSIISAVNNLTVKVEQEADFLSARQSGLMEG